MIRYKESLSLYKISETSLPGNNPNALDHVHPLELFHKFLSYINIQMLINFISNEFKDAPRKSSPKF